MKNLFTYLKALWGAWGNLQSKDVSLDCRRSDLRRSPSGLDAKWKQNPFMRFAVVLTLIFTIGSGNVWGAADYIIPKLYLSARNTPSGNTGWTFTSASCDNAKTDYWKMVSSGSVVTSPAFDISGYTNVTVSIKWGSFGSFKKTKCNATVKISTGSGTWTTLGQTGLTGANTSGAVSNFENVEESSSYSSAQIQISTPSADGSNGGRIYYVEIKGEAAGSCDASPTVGNASLNGSVSLSSVPFSCTVSSEGGTGCSITDAGFVWKSGSDPSESDNKTAGTFSTNITGTIPSAGSFSTGTTYYVKAYATNGNGTVLSGTSYQYRVQSVTFNGNTSTSGSMSTQYVKYNTSTALTSNAFSKTGHTFAGWATAADGSVVYTNGQSVSATSDLSLYAKWTAKQCTVNFDKEGGTGTITSVTATYGQAMPSKESNLPTKDGYDFDGFWDGDNGTGTQYYNADGTSKINWNKDVTATQTLYAKWTAKNYTVTWMVNGVAYTTGDPSDNADYGAQVTKLPTAPTPPCGEVFVGWSKTNIGTTGLDKDDDAAAITALNLFTTPAGSPTIEGSTIFYAVFADYTTE